MATVYNNEQTFDAGSLRQSPIKDADVLNNYCHDITLYRGFQRIPMAMYCDDDDIEIDRNSNEWCLRFYQEIKEILQYYRDYKMGVEFDGHKHGSGCSEPSCLNFKKISQLINKQARFMFGKYPDIKLTLAMDLGNYSEEIKKGIEVQQQFVDRVLESNGFENLLMKAVKDCFIGKRVACVLNFNEDSGITVDFISSLNFMYKFDIRDKKKLAEFVLFEPLNSESHLESYHIMKKTYKLVTISNEEEQVVERCMITERVFDGCGNDVSDLYEELELFDHEVTELSFIPAEIIFNDGLLNDVRGVSDVEELEQYEKWYSALSCLDIDAQRTNMNPMKYTINVDSSTTKNITNRIGGYADLTQDRNDNLSTPQIGMLESDMKYKAALEETEKRIRANMYETFDVPDIALDTLVGTITSGKALKAVYWGLIVRCEEKMKLWAPGIRNVIRMIIDGASAYPDCAVYYLESESLPTAIPYDVVVSRLDPLPEDEQEEKELNMQEVNSNVMSRKSYIMKHQDMTDSQAAEELIQIAIEQNLLDNTALPLDGVSENTLIQKINEQFDEISGNTTQEEIPDPDDMENVLSNEV